MKKTPFLKKLSIGLGLFVALSLVSLSVSSQNLSITASLGGSNLLSDLNAGYIPPYKADFSLGATYDINNRLRGRANISFPTVAADDANSPNAGVKNRNLNVKTNIQELALLFEGDIVDNENSSVIPYAFVGGAVYHFVPHPLNTIDSLGDVDLHSIGTEGQYLPSGKYADRQYKLTQLNVQFGLGVRVEFSSNVSLAFEGTYRKLFTDYLDDASAKSYILKPEWEEGIQTALQQGNTGLANRLKLAEAYSWRYIDSKGNAVPLPSTNPGIGFKRGNPENKDVFFSFQLRLNVRLENLFFSSDLYTPTHRTGRGQLRNPGRVF